jgi:type I restriction enzyme S subunit
MMADLFTRGIDLSGTAETNPNHGQLRPTFEEAPELYKETELGWVPREWEVRSLESLLANTISPMRSGPFGSALLKNELVESGVPLLGIDNIFVEYFENKFRRFVPEHKYRDLARYSVNPRDVIITIMGTVGRCCVVPDDFKKGLSSKHLWTMTFDQKIIIPELVCWQLNYAPWVQTWFRGQSQGAVMDAIQSITLRSVLLPLPSLAEQSVIFSIYRSQSDKINIERDFVDKLKQQKKGLMQDLLTGKVRVNP